jgi:hypothetical protein
MALIGSLLPYVIVISVPLGIIVMVVGLWKIMQYIWYDGVPWIQEQYSSCIKPYLPDFSSFLETLKGSYDYFASWVAWAWNSTSSSISYYIPDFCKKFYAENIVPNMNCLSSVQPKEKEVEETPELTGEEKDTGKPIFPWVIGILVAILLFLYLRNGGT